MLFKLNRTDGGKTEMTNKIKVLFMIDFVDMISSFNLYVISCLFDLLKLIVH
jgi:hypothetical protein